MRSIAKPAPRPVPPAREKGVRRHSAKADRLANERLERDIHAFAYSIAHDLRAPLRHIHGYSEFLLNGSDAASKPYARRIMAATRRMDALISDLLVYSRLTLDEMDLRRVEPSVVLERVLAGMEQDREARGAVLDVEVPLPAVLAQPEALAQIFENLLSNALKFTPLCLYPRIRVRGEARGDAVRLWVEDNGIGIRPVYREKIFDVFQRLHRSDELPGTGIGLAIVRRAAERMGGGVGVEPAPGRGSRFWVDLKPG